MKMPYFEETYSFILEFGDDIWLDTVAITESFLVPLGLGDRVAGIESINASRDLGIVNPLANPPRFKWIELVDSLCAPPRERPRDRHIIYRPAQDSLYMEFALGEPVATEPVIDGVHAEINADGGVAGLMIADASRNIDLAYILADGAPVIEWEPHPARVVAGIAT